jgi:hypothetical protein
VTSSKFWDVSQDSKLPLRASRAALQDLILPKLNPLLYSKDLEKKNSKL